MRRRTLAAPGTEDDETASADDASGVDEAES